MLATGSLGTRLTVKLPHLFYCLTRLSVGDFFLPKTTYACKALATRQSLVCILSGYSSNSMSASSRAASCSHTHAHVSNHEFI
jgi:hypothetical protein